MPFGRSAHPPARPATHIPPGPVTKTSVRLVRRSGTYGSEPEYGTLIGIPGHALRDGCRTLDEMLRNVGLLAIPPDPFGQQVSRSLRGRFVWPPVVVHVDHQLLDAVR